MRALALCEDAVLREATKRALVSPQLPILPHQLLSREQRDALAAERSERELDAGAASSKSILSIMSGSTETEDSSHDMAHGRPPPAFEANAVELPDLLGMVFGPYLSTESGPAGPANAARFSPADLEALLPHMRSRRLLCGEALWRRGDEAAGMFLVHAGKLQISLPKGPQAAKRARDASLSVPSPGDGLRSTSPRIFNPGPASHAGRADEAAATAAAPQEPLVLEVLIPGSILGYLHGLCSPPRPRSARASVRLY